MRPKAVDRRGHQPKVAESGMDHSLASPALEGAGTPLHFKFKRILVPIDFSEGAKLALDCALDLGRQLESKIMLLHVVEPAGYQENTFGINPPMGQTNENLVMAGRERLDLLIQAREHGGQQIESLVRIGRAHSEIVDTAKAMAADLIVVGTQSGPGMNQPPLESTAERVVHHATCPVLVVRVPGRG